jgi:hypothetical protein
MRAPEGGRVEQRGGPPLTGPRVTARLQRMSESAACGDEFAWLKTEVPACVSTC